MTLAEILEALQTGELAFLKVGDLAKANEVDKVVAHLNLGLIDLHTRFLLRRKEVDVWVLPEVRDYELHASRGKIWGTEGVTYLADSPEEPFQNDLLKINKIYNKGSLEKLDEYDRILVNRGREDCRDYRTYPELPLNDDNRPDSFHELAFNVVRIPPNYDSPTFTVEYRAVGDKITYKVGDDPCRIQVPISRAFLQAILYWVGYRVTSSLNTDQAQEQINYFKLYEQTLARLSSMGHQITPDGTNLRLDCNGWV
jgi:hypothetical protein